MKLFKYYNIQWEKDANYIIRKNSKWSDGSLRKVNLLMVYERSIEFAFLPLEEDKSFILLKSDFHWMGDWEMIEQL